MLGLTMQQLTAVAVVVGMLVFFVWDRWRYDVVALCALLLSIVLGIVPQKDAFSGFSDTVIVVIASVLVVSRAIARSGLLDRAVRRLLKGIESPSLQIGLLSGAVALLSAFVKNVGTLAIFMPIAIQVARRSKRSPSLYLMPLAFASLIGGTITQIGTSPNLLISSVRRDVSGAPFTLFDFAWVGLPLTVLVVAFLMLGWRSLPRDRHGSGSPDEKFQIDNYMTELAVLEGSPMAGKTVADLEASGDDVVVLAVTREGGHNYIPSPYWRLYAGDVVTVKAEPATVKDLVEAAGLVLEPAAELGTGGTGQDEITTIEAIVTGLSPLVGQTPKSIGLRRAYDVNLLAVSRAGAARAQRLNAHVFQVGDVILLQGWDSTLKATLQELGMLPLADRSLALGKVTDGLVPLGVLVAALVLVSMKLLTVAVGFFAAAVLIVVLKQLPLKQAYESIEGPVLVLLGSLIPIAHSLETTGVTDLLGHRLAVIGAQVPGFAALGLMLATAMIVTPFLNNAAAVLMLGPVAAVVAKELGYNADPFLIAVALGCACDFLTPIGHQNNLLVMGPGGYRFGDYWRLGLPISLMILAAGTPLIMLFWPLK